jgi:hypothetical protein
MTVNPYRNLTSIGYLFQAPEELPVTQLKTELVFKSTDTLEGIEKTTLDKTAEMVSAVIEPEIKEGFSMPEQTITSRGPEGSVNFDNVIAVAKRLVKRELDRIKEKISQDIEAVKSNPGLIANIPKETAWNISTAFLFFTNPDRRAIAAITEVNITEPPALSLPESSLLNSALVQHKSIAEARDSLEAEKKARQQTVNTGGRAFIDRLTRPGRRLADIKIISTGITLSFPEYQDMIAKLAGVTAARIITAALTPLIISGGVLALFALLPRFVEQKQQ